MKSSSSTINLDDLTSAKFKKLKSSGSTINLDNQPTAKFNKLKSSGSTINLDEDKATAKRRLTDKTTDKDNVFKPPIVQPPAKKT